LAEARRQDVEEFVGDLLARNSAATASVRYRALRVFYDWLEEEGEIAESPMRRMKPPAVPDKPVQVLTEEQLRRLLAACAGKDFEARRDTALIMLLLVTVAMAMPALFELVAGEGLPAPGTRAIDFPPALDQMSVGVAVVLLATYAAGLIFSLRTHRDLFNPVADEEEQHVREETWSVRRSVAMLALAGVAVGVMSEILVGSITEASESIGLSTFFVGLIVVAVVGNAAEHWVAIYFARRDRMDLSVNIAIGPAPRSPCSWRRCWCPRRSSSVPSRWRWSSTGSSWARSCSRC
jgi:hypothetical protein